MFAQYEDHGGTDLSVVNAARVSFDNKSEWDLVLVGDQDHGDTGGAPRGYAKKLKAKDVNLIQYLARGMSKKEWTEKLLEIMGHGTVYSTLADKTTPMAATIYDQVEGTVTDLMYMAQHWVPFTHNWIELRMSAPVPIRTQSFKHKVGFTESEESRRYISSRPVLFVPDTFSSAAANVKQGAGGVHPNSAQWLEIYTNHAQAGIELYTRMIGAGIAPEEARFILPQGVEVNWIWSGNLASYARYYNQRTDLHAQKASRELAEMVGKIIAPLFPVSWEALTLSGRVE